MAAKPMGNWQIPREFAEFAPKASSRPAYQEELFQDLPGA
jgi:hypothetical protein